MQRSAEVHRVEFEELGYTIFKGVLTPEEVEAAIPIFDATLGPDVGPPHTTGNGPGMNGRRQLNQKYCEPRLANLAGHSRVLEAVEVLLGPSYRLAGSSVPTVTYKSPPGKENFELGRHVDWTQTPPRELDETCIFGALHFSSVEPQGGAFALCPRSHRLVLEKLNDPEISQQMYAQKFNDGFPGLEPLEEVLAEAGDLLLFHAFLVHDRTENIREQPRKALFVHFKPYNSPENREAEKGKPEDFHPDHVASMDERFRALCGLN